MIRNRTPGEIVLGDRLINENKRYRPVESDHEDGGEELDVYEVVKQPHEHHDGYTDWDYTYPNMTEADKEYSMQKINEIPTKLRPDRVIRFEDNDASDATGVNRFVLNKNAMLKESRKRDDEASMFAKAANKAAEYAKTDRTKYPVHLQGNELTKLNYKREVNYVEDISDDIGIEICNYLFLYDPNFKDFVITWRAYHISALKEIYLEFPMYELQSHVMLSSAVIHKIIFHVAEQMPGKNEVEVICKFNDVNSFTQKNIDENPQTEDFSKKLTEQDILRIGMERMKCKLWFETDDILGNDNIEIPLDKISNMDAILIFKMLGKLYIG